MKSKLVPLLAGILFMMAGLAYLYLAITSGKTVNYALGGAFAAVGVVFLINAKKSGK